MTTCAHMGYAEEISVGDIRTYTPKKVVTIQRGPIMVISLLLNSMALEAELPKVFVCSLIFASALHIEQRWQW